MEVGDTVRSEVGFDDYLAQLKGIETVTLSSGASHEALKLVVRATGAQGDNFDLHIWFVKKLGIVKMQRDVNLSVFGDEICFMICDSNTAEIESSIIK